ncbi:hypothetical protein BXT84_10330 [Sulfobacillus thermotolerans]|uniref:Major facilitator superfamily (MFS) profile domain-containing protein n=1 Tax=Sulfobacillus thermotolerans TaxID=338644 RepID=A0ABM6RVY3_9FIRM|nr:hypothetical protein BXT84_10330 [Sulfobacillus thermotolerans]
MIWSIAHAINDGYPTLYLALLPVLMVRWHFGVAQAGLLAGFLTLTTQAMQPLWGWWADRLGGPWFIVGGLVAGSVGNALGLAWAPSYAVFALALMLAGLGNAAFHPHMAALVTQTDSTDKGRKMSGWMVSGMIGHALAPLVAVAMWQWEGKWGLTAMAIPGVLAAGILYQSARKLKRPAATVKPHAREALRNAWNRGRAFFLMIVLRNLGTASLLTLLPIFWTHRGGALSQTGLLLSIVYAAGMIGNLMGGRQSDRWGPRPILVISLLGAAGAALGWPLISGTKDIFWFAVAVWGFMINGAGAVLLVYGQSLFPGRAGMASGLTLGLGNTIGGFGAWVMGRLAESGGLSWAVIAAALCLAASILPAIWLAV